MKPVLLGYQTVRVGASPDEVENGRRVLAAFAERGGYDLGRVFVDHDPNKPLSAFAALICAIQSSSITAVAVPTLDDLGRLPRIRHILRRQLERETGVVVHVAQPVRRAGDAFSAPALRQDSDSHR